jgi:Cu(I)/Ag(I) efflux system protein CusF
MKHQVNSLLFVALVSIGSFGVAVAAPEAPESMQRTPDTSLGLTTGEVRKVDAEERKLIIKHEAIENLAMPAMTMVFKTKTPELLRNLQAGDRIRFRAERVAGVLMVTQIQAAK